MSHKDKRESLEGFLREEGLRKALREAHLKLAKAQDHREELVRAVERASVEAIAGLSIPKVRTIKRDTGKGTAQPAICVLSDWQLAKMTASYNSDVARGRVEEYADKVARIVQAHRSDHPVNEMYVFLLGDIVEGEQVFPGQSYHIDASLFNQTLVTGPQILCGFLRQMLTVVKKIKVYGVVGNHGALGGRSRKEYHPESNADLMVYETSRQILTGERGIEWGDLAGGIERRWFQIAEPAGQRCFLFHGDQIKGGFAGYPWYGFGRMLLRWNRKYNFRYAYSGHFHTPVRMYVNGIVGYGNGSLESDNTYAEESLGGTGEPQQLLMFMHPRHGVTAEHWVGLS